MKKNILHDANPVRDLRTFEQGLTLIEVLIVLAILGVFALVATPSIIKSIGVAKVKACQLELDNMDTALGLYFSANDNGYPDSLESLKKDGYLKSRKALTDPFNTPYLYSKNSDGGEYTLKSSGPDKTINTEDDLISHNSTVK